MIPFPSWSDIRKFSARKNQANPPSLYKTTKTFSIVFSEYGTLDHGLHDFRNGIPAFPQMNFQAGKEMEHDPRIFPQTFLRKTVSHLVRKNIVQGLGIEDAKAPVFQRSQRCFGDFFVGPIRYGTETAL